MDYLSTETHNGGILKCSFSGKEFAYKKTMDGSDLRRAENELGWHQTGVREAREKAAGRKLTRRELYEGIQHPETRTVAERSVTIRPDETKDPNPADTVVQQLKARLKICPRDERQGLLNRIEMYGEMAAEQEVKNEIEHATEQAEAAKESNPKYQQAMKHSNLILDSLRWNSDVPQQQIEEAQARLAALEQSGDSKKYWQDVKPYILARNRKADAAAKMKTQEARILTDQADEIRRTGDIPSDVVAEMQAQQQGERQ